MKKRILAFVLAMVMVLGLAACGGNNTPAETKANTATETKRIFQPPFERIKPYKID